jgi:hypothetical protein
LTERACGAQPRPTAAGKKNWIFIGHAECGQRSAILFTLIEACRHLVINPFDYLKDALTQIPRNANKTVAQLTSENRLKKRQTRTARTALTIDLIYSAYDIYELLVVTSIKGALGVTLTIRQASVGYFTPHQ